MIAFIKGIVKLSSSLIGIISKAVTNVLDKKVTASTDHSWFPGMENKIEKVTIKEAAKKAREPSIDFSFTRRLFPNRIPIIADNGSAVAM